MKTNITFAFILFNFFCVSIFAQDKPAVGFELPIVQATAGDTVCLDVTVKEFENILGFQWGILFDTTALEFLAFNGAFFLIRQLWNFWPSMTLVWPVQVFSLELLW